jgi:hypothetical protein
LIFQIAIVSYTQDGMLDSDFNGDGRLLFDIGEQDCFANALAVQDDG